MITTELEYQITKKRYLQAMVALFNLIDEHNDNPEQELDPAIYKAMQDSLKNEIDILFKQIMLWEEKTAKIPQWIYAAAEEINDKILRSRDEINIDKISGTIFEKYISTPTKIIL
jgi:hypothetical protein